MLEMKILLLLLLGILSDAISFDSAEDGYEMLINHDPWWRFHSGGNGHESSYQYYYPFFDNNDDPGSFHWHVPAIKPPKFPKPPVRPTPPSHPDMATREWPSWLPPIRLIKLPLDEPPAAI